MVLLNYNEKYAKIFLSVENLGRDEAHLYETSTYVVQGKTQFKAKISKPLGASGDCDHCEIQIDSKY